MGLGSDAGEVTSMDALHREILQGGVIASAGRAARRQACDQKLAVQSGGAVPSGAPRRYGSWLVGGHVQRFSADDPELPSLLRCSVPVIIEGSRLLGTTSDLWTFDYLEHHLKDVDSFFVLCAPAGSKGRFAYYDANAKKNPCGHTVVQSNERVEMRFHEFHCKARSAQKLHQAGKPTSMFYLQNVLLHREEHVPGAPQPVGGFGSNCGKEVMKDIKAFRWKWLKQMMNGLEVQICQFFCGMQGGFSPCHYDPQDNLFAQVCGWKRVLLFHPRHFASLYPWPVHHPQDRQSRVNFDSPDDGAFPKFQELAGCGLEAILGPGDVLRIPPGWWHHIEMLPSPPRGECVSVNFWYEAPSWFYGDVRLGNISWDIPLFGMKRVLFQRGIEELVSQFAHPSKVEEVVRICAGGVNAVDLPAQHPLHGAVQAVFQILA